MVSLNELGFGFNPGSALLLGKEIMYGEVAANAAVATALSGAAGGVGALFSNYFLEERRTGDPKFDIIMAMNGALSGLVAVTSGCALVEPYMAIVIGTVAGWFYMYFSSLLVRLRIDDAVDAIPVHMVNGAWGILATGLFASPDKLELTYGNSDNPGLFYSFKTGIDARLLLSQICGLFFILGWTLFTMLPFFIWLNYMYVAMIARLCEHVLALWSILHAYLRAVRSIISASLSQGVASRRFTRRTSGFGHLIPWAPSVRSK